jgi:hypothetical protein
LSVEQKATLGFVPLETPVDRARSCLPCHVGSSVDDQIHGLVDVNHDLIAAGHPRLNFEFASYYSQYPKHWGDVKERLHDPSHEARAWVLGQLATAEAALQLLRARAEKSEQLIVEGMPQPLNGSALSVSHSGPWPEFAEYNCYACHHNLRGGVAIEVGLASAVPGELPWGDWYTPMIDVIASEMPPSDRNWSKLIASVEAEMIHPLPESRRVMDRVDKTLSVIDAWLIDLRSRPIDAGVVDRLMSAAIEQLRSSTDPTWDRNAQGYLALAALYAAQCDLDPNRRDPAIAGALNTMLSRLSFQGDSNSPPEYRITEMDSPLSAIRSRLIFDE